MGARSKIEWTDSTFNPWVGCTKIARAKRAPSACDFCYAEKWAKRSGQVGWGNYPRRRTTEVYWRGPLTWNERAKSFQIKHRRRQRVFCASLADVFDNQVELGVAIRLVRTHSQVRSIGLAASNETAAKYSKYAAARLGCRISQCLAWHDRRGCRRLPAKGSLFAQYPIGCSFC